MTLSGLLGLLLTPLDIYTKTKLNGDFTPGNIVLLVLGIVTATALAVRVYTYTRINQGKVRLRGDDEGFSNFSRIEGAIREESEDEH